MKPQVTRIFGAMSISLALLAGPLRAVAQEKPDRPPWAQPSSNQPAKSEPSNGQPSGGQPGGGPAGAIVPTPQTEPEKQQTTQTPKGAIKVNVNLVNVLVSVVDEQKRPAPNLPKDAFQVLEEGVPQKIDFSRRKPRGRWT